MDNLISWEPFQFFSGKWEGHKTGKAGIGKGEREYRFIMGEKFILPKV